MTNTLSNKDAEIVGEHTPGPYRVEGPDPFGDYNILHPADTLAVAAVVSNMRTAEEVKANAHLFAASFEMLEALELATAFYDSLEQPPFPGEHAVLDRMAAAIAKAKGGAK